MSRKLCIKIHGREYSVRTDQSEERIRRVEKLVESLLQETASGRAVDSQNLTVLALLNLAGKYLQLEEDSHHSQEYEQRLDSLLEELERS